MLKSKEDQEGGTGVVRSLLQVMLTRPKTLPLEIASELTGHVADDSIVLDHPKLPLPLDIPYTAEDFSQMPCTKNLAC